MPQNAYPWAAVPYQQRPLFVSAIGDSITAGNIPTIDLNAFSAAQTYLIQSRQLGGASYLLHGALRSQGAWAPYEYIGAGSGFTTTTIFSTALPALLGYPYGPSVPQPDACVVLAGTNDYTANNLPASLANLKQTYASLLSRRIVPIACTIPPNNAATAFVEAFNHGVLRLAYEMRLPLADFYGALTAATGNWGNANWTLDNLHPSQLGAAIMGYVLNQVITQAFSLSPSRLTTAAYASASAFQNADPNFQTFAGTVNTGSSYPTAQGFGVPGTAAMCTIFNPAGTEPGTGHTMRAATPAINGDATTPNYLGNAFSMAGDGTHTLGFYGAQLPNVAKAGDRIAISFRVKWVPNRAAGSFGQFGISLQFNGVTACGINYAGTNAAAMQAQIGSEAGYFAGEFYQEMTVLPANAGVVQIFLNAQNAAGASNTGDSVTFSNLLIQNLTQQGIVAP